MLPELDIDLSEDYEEEEEPSKVWKLDTLSGHIRGTVDGIEAVQQAVYCILNTERYETLIYSWDYGVEFMDLFGKPLGYVMPELIRRVEEALEQDDRISGVSDFIFDRSKKGVVGMAFIVHTVYGEIYAEKEVDV